MLWKLPAPSLLPMMESNTTAIDSSTPNENSSVRRKARRAPRQKRSFKPYSVLTWQERKELEAKDALEPPSVPKVPSAGTDDRSSKKRRRRHGASREQPPPAPKITTQLILAERLSPKNPEDSFTNMDEPVESSLSSDSTGENYFDRAFEACFYDELTALKQEDLIKLIQERDHELELLRAEVAVLKAGRVSSS